jgi:hypothetical protein
MELNNHKSEEIKKMSVGDLEIGIQKVCEELHGLYGFKVDDPEKKQDVEKRISNLRGYLQDYNTILEIKTRNQGYH